MRLTFKDIREILGYLEVAKATTERGLRESSPESIYHKTMTEQLAKVTALIEKIENMEV